MILATSQIAWRTRHALWYQALLQAASAVLMLAGYRPRGAGPGHHHDLFYAVSGLGIPGLEDIAIRTERVRKQRSRSVYEPDFSTEADLGDVYGLQDALLPPIRRWLEASRPDIASKLPLWPAGR